jgi:hypothetical protein
MRAAPTLPRKDTSSLTQAIVDALARQPQRSIDSLAAELGCSTGPIRTRMNKLLEDGKVKFVIRAGAAAFARLKLWSVTDGDAMSAADLLEAPDLGAGAVPRQAVIRHYPPIDRRDPLVAALFGPAHKERA